MATMNTPTDISNDQVAEIAVVREDGKPTIRVSVPRGTPFARTAQLHDKIDAVITKLTGCGPCNSGIPVFIREHDLIERVVHVDLQHMREVG